MPRPRNPRLDDPQWLRSQYTDKSTVAIATEIGCSPGAVQLALRRFGLEVRAAAPVRYPQLRDTEWLRNTYAQFTTWEIAEQLGCDQSIVWKAVKGAGISRNRGKRRRRSLYKQVRNPNGYGSLPEHRLIVERQLDRKLNSDEHVHHINGIKDDNRPENLSVLSESEHHSHHGATYQRTCIICGSVFCGGNRSKWCNFCHPNPQQLRREH